MKADFSVLKEPLKQIISNIYKDAKRSPIDSYRQVYIKNVNGTLEVYANSEIKAIRYLIKTDIPEEFNFVVDAKKFNDAINIVGYGDLIVNENHIVVKGKKKRIKIAKYEDYYNLLTESSFDIVEYGDVNFKEGIDIVGNFISTSKYDDILANVFFYNDGTFLKCVATNRHQLALYTYREENVNIPKDGITISEFNFENDVYKYYRYYVDDVVAYNVFKRTTDKFEEEIYLRIIANTYPNTSGITNVSGNYKTIKLNKKEVFDFIKTTNKLFGSTCTFFAMNIKDNKIVLKSFDGSNPDNKYEQELEDYETNIGELSVGFNIEYMTNLLNNVGDDYAEFIKYNAIDAYYILQENLLQLIMPVVLDYM